MILLPCCNLETEISGRPIVSYKLDKGIIQTIMSYVYHRNEIMLLVEGKCELQKVASNKKNHLVLTINTGE